MQPCGWPRNSFDYLRRGRLRAWDGEGATAGRLHSDETNCVIVFIHGLQNCGPIGDSQLARTLRNRNRKGSNIYSKDRVVKRQPARTDTLTKASRLISPHLNASFNDTSSESLSGSTDFSPITSASSLSSPGFPTGWRILEITFRLPTDQPSATGQSDDFQGQNQNVPIWDFILRSCFLDDSSSAFSSCFRAFSCRLRSFSAARYVARSSLYACTSGSCWTEKPEIDMVAVESA